MYTTTVRAKWRVLSNYTGMMRKLSYYTVQVQAWRVHCPISFFFVFWYFYYILEVSYILQRKKKDTITYIHIQKTTRILQAQDTLSRLQQIIVNYLKT